MKLSGLSTQSIGRDILWLEEVDSTNHYAKENAGELRHHTLVMTGRQTTGRGRMGRSWSFDDGKSLAMSLLLKDFPLEQLTRLPLLFAVGVRQGLSRLCGLEFGIKWSNDILWEGKKVCGILCESRSAPGSSIAVGGIGANIAQTRKELDNHDLLYASSLFLATNKLFSMEEVAAAICNELEKAFRALEDQGFDAVLSQYRSHCVTLGKRVQITLDGREQEGMALDIAPDGSLLCNIDGKIRSINAGEASVRGMMGYAD